MDLVYTSLALCVLVQSETDIPKEIKEKIFKEEICPKTGQTEEEICLKTGQIEEEICPKIGQTEEEICWKIIRKIENLSCVTLCWNRWNKFDEIHA